MAAQIPLNKRIENIILTFVLSRDVPAVADLAEIRGVVYHRPLLEPLGVHGMLLILVSSLAITTPATVLVLPVPPLEQRDEVPQAEDLPAAVMDFKRDFDVPLHFPLDPKPLSPRTDGRKYSVTTTSSHVLTFTGTICAILSPARIL